MPHEQFQPFLFETQPECQLFRWKHFWTKVIFTTEKIVAASCIKCCDLWTEASEKTSWARCHIKDFHPKERGWEVSEQLLNQLVIFALGMYIFLLPLFCSSKTPNFLLFWADKLTNLPTDYGICQTNTVKDIFTLPGQRIPKTNVHDYVIY